MFKDNLLKLLLEKSLEIRTIFLFCLHLDATSGYLMAYPLFYLIYSLPGLRITWLLQSDMLEEVQLLVESLVS